jgi:RHS repeat-associated protein
VPDTTDDPFPRPSPDAGDRAADKPAPGLLPVLSLPKGGGAIRGIGEKFAANPATGAGTLTIPLHCSRGRSGFGPDLALSYSSGAGNGPFGFGWSLSLPAITRKTSKGLPRYRDADESDVFILSGAEDLTPALVSAGGQWTRDVTPTRTLYGHTYAIHRYRPRVDTLFARIERWLNLDDPSDTFWRTVTKDNITSWYGTSAGSRIADPADPARVYSWLICEGYDDRGDAIAYEYKAEDSAGVDLSKVHERNRTDASRTANRYIKRIVYGNRTPYRPDLGREEAPGLPSDWCFELVFDYGEHDLSDPVPQDTLMPWTCRLDAFSDYRATFEVRTYRLCRRALMFHNFPDDPAIGTGCAVRSTDLTHASPPPGDPSQPFYSYLQAATQTGYRPDQAGGYVTASLPPVEFQYTTATVDETVRVVTEQNVPEGVDGTSYRWCDLDGEGSAGILTEQASAWFYKANLSAANIRQSNGTAIRLPRFAPQELIASKPSTAALRAGGQQLFSISGDGQLDIVDLRSPTPGYYERTDDATWMPLMPFATLPPVDWNDPELRYVDLTGDGFPDLLISDGDTFRWHESLSTAGFGPEHCVPTARDEERGPHLIFADGTASIFLADLSGDGLTDLVRIRHGEVCYWPNLGYGRFGAKVTMDNAPLLDTPDLFDGRRIQLADIDGSGTADIIYRTARGRVQLCFNQSGNGWGTARQLDYFPATESDTGLTVVDLLGSGTACLVWSSPLPGNARAPMRYIDLMGGQKPHLLVNVTNNLGASTTVDYAPSTKFYVADKLAGTPWVTRLPFPVQVVERIETFDYVSRNLFVTRYTYHHGYYDGVEREFRGFGRVDQWDTEEYATLSPSPDLPEPTNLAAASNTPPVLTKTWFHTGAYFGEAAVSTAMAADYYPEGDPASGLPGLSPAGLGRLLLDDTVLPATILLPNGSSFPYPFSPEENREACRALRGRALRQEVYGLDNSPAQDRPYTVTESNYTIEGLQPQGPNRYGVFFAHARESVTLNYERALYSTDGTSIVAPGTPGSTQAADPRVTHELTLAVDQYGNTLQTAAIAYGRRFRDPTLSASDQATQGATLSTYTQNTYTNAVEAADAHRTPASAQTTTYELLQLATSASTPGSTTLFSFAEIQAALHTAGDGSHDIPYEDLTPGGLIAGQVYRRQIGCVRSYYRPDDLGAAAGDPRALLALETLESLALPGTTCTLALTLGLVTQVLQTGAAPLVPAASVLGSAGPAGGGYVDLDRDGNWWIPAPRVYFTPLPPSSPQELDQAQAHFFLPRRVEDSFGNASTVDYDGNDLLAVQSTDAVRNIISVVNDYRVLAAVQLTDPNGNQSSVSFNTLGLLTATAVSGKTGQNLGDSLTGFTLDPPSAQVDAFYAAADPATLAPGFLGNATTRVIYDLDRFRTSRLAAPSQPTAWQPAFAATIARETHTSDLPAGQQSKLQIALVHSDGFGRTIQTKTRAEAGPLGPAGPSVSPRWVGSGWTIYDNKGQPIRQYEPFFSALPTAGQQFEFATQVGVSPILLRDPPGRLVGTIHPNHTYEKIVFDPWYQQHWDVNDTVTADPAADPDIGGLVQRLPAADYAPTWYAQRAGGGLGAIEQATAGKAAACAKTPSLAHCDPLGRAFLTIADNGPAESYPTHIGLDIQGYQRSVTDALGRLALTADYTLTGTAIHQHSIDAGDRWALSSADGKTIETWDRRGFQTQSGYDAARRPATLVVAGPGQAPRLAEKRVYGETAANAQALNLCATLYQQYDEAGIATTTARDFNGNIVSTMRQIILDPAAAVDWTAPVPAMQAFTAAAAFDALNRITSATSPDGSVTTPAYNERSLLISSTVDLRGTGTVTRVIAAITYNAKGQRLALQYGNGASTTYTYDPDTFRLLNLTTVRPSPNATLQNLTYSYDPIGNVAHVTDGAQQTLFYNNQVVPPDRDYSYDPIYRLTRASGREHIGQAAQPATSWDDSQRIAVPSPTDGQAMRAYCEKYSYDKVGNLQSVAHTANQGNWTRTYTYGGAGTAPASDQLTLSTVGTVNETYAYDPNGNMITMPQLSAMSWDWHNRLQSTAGQSGNTATAPTTWYRYDSGGERIRKATRNANGAIIADRVYLGAYELYRSYSPAATPTDMAAVPTVERHSLHVTIGTDLTCLIETTIADPSLSAGSLPQVTQRFQLGDLLSSSAVELDAAAALLTYEEYYPYGSTSFQTGASAAEVSLKRYRCTGKERDAETALYYYGARYYAPWLGRWTAPDPLGLRDGPNPYAYVRCNPVRLVDPTGTQSGDTVLTCGGLVSSQSVEMTDQACSDVGHLADQVQENPAGEVALEEWNFGAAQPKVDTAKIVNDVKAQVAGQPPQYLKEAIQAQDFAQARAEDEAYEFRKHEDEVAKDMPTGLEDAAPVLGNGASGVVRYKHHDYVLGTADMLLAVSDALMVKALVGGAAKLAISGGARLLAAAAIEDTAATAGRTALGSEVQWGATLRPTGLTWDAASLEAQSRLGLTYSQGYQLGADFGRTNQTLVLGKFPANVEHVAANAGTYTVDRPWGWTAMYNAGAVRGVLEEGGGILLIPGAPTGTFGLELRQVLSEPGARISSSMSLADWKLSLGMP